MSSAGSIISFDSSTLLSYYQAKLGAASVATQSASASASATAAAAAANSATAADSPPWEVTPPAQEARDAQVLGITNFLDTSNVPLLTSSANNADMEQDNQKLFSLYTAVNNLSYLASMAARTGMTAGQLAGFNTRFQTGLQQVQSYLNSTTFNNFTLQAGTPSSSVTSSATVPNATFDYTTRSLTTDANIANALPNVSASDSFTVSIKKGGVTTDVPIDLSQVQGTLSVDNIVNYVNQQLSNAGFGTRFHRTITSGTIDDAQNASYGIEIDPSASETVSLSSVSATPALYVASSSGLATATTTAISTAATSTASTATTDVAADQTGRLVKLGGLDGTPQSAFSANANSTSGTTTAQSTVVDGNGNVYVIGNATGNFGNQLNQGTQDVYLTKYDSAGNVQWTQMLGSAGSASGYGLALDPTGGVVVSGSTTADLTSTAIADGNADSFVAKYDANGGQTWVKQIQTLNANQAAAVSVDASGNIYIGGQVTGVIGSGQTNSGGGDAYIAKLDSKGNIVSENQFGTSASDSVAATATASDGGLVVASVQNGHAIVSKYANGDVTSAPVWQEDLGALQNGGSIGGMTISGGQIYVTGTTSNTSLNAGGTATVANASSGSKDAFVFNLTDQGTSATANYVSYVGTTGSDSGNAVAVGPDGTVYLTGSTTGTFAGQIRQVANVNNAFVSALSSDGSVDWTQQYGGADGQSTGQGIAIDAQGTSVLDALGLPRGTITINQSVDLTQLTTLRAGDSFQIQIQGTTARTATVTIDQGETLKSLANKINIELQNAGSASTNYALGGEGLKIQVNPGFSATLIAGPADLDALGRLGIAAGTISSASTSSTSSSSTSSSNSASQPQVFGLGIPTGMDLSTSTGAAAARAELLNALTTVQTTYQTTNTPASSTTASTTQSTGTVPAYLQSQIANYTLAASLLSAASTSSTSGSA